MPSPFTRRQAATSTVNVDRPVAVTPVPERVKGHVFPYRGMEQHGVDPNNDAQNPEDYGWMEEQRGVVVDYEAAPDMPDPIPVMVVTRAGREMRRFRVTRVTVDPSSGANQGQPRAIIGRDASRRTVIVKNTSADPVYIGHDQTTASPMHGYPLSQNETLTMNGEEPIFAISSTANQCVLAMYIDFVDVINDEANTYRG